MDITFALVLLSLLGNNAWWEQGFATDLPLTKAHEIYEIPLEIEGATMERLDDRTLMLTTYKPGRFLTLLDWPTKEARQIAHIGKGPDEVPGGAATVSRYHGNIMMSGTGTHHLFRRDGTKIFSKSATLSMSYGRFIPIDEIRMWVINLFPKPEGQDQFAVDTIRASVLVKVKATEDEWVPISYALDDMWMVQSKPEPHAGMAIDRADSHFRFKCTLVEGPENRFYFVPRWGYPDIRVLNDEGELVHQFRIPHPLADESHRDNDVRFRLFVGEQRHHGNMLLDADSDGAGNLHLLPDSIVYTHPSGERENFTGRVVVTLNPMGNLLRVVKLDQPVRFLRVSRDGNVYYGLHRDEGPDDESGNTLLEYRALEPLVKN